MGTFKDVRRVKALIMRYFHLRIRNISQNKQVIDFEILGKCTCLCTDGNKTLSYKSDKKKSHIFYF